MFTSINIRSASKPRAARAAAVRALTIRTGGTQSGAGTAAGCSWGLLGTVPPGVTQDIDCFVPYRCLTAPEAPQILAPGMLFCP